MLAVIITQCCRVCPVVSHRIQRFDTGPLSSLPNTMQEDFAAVQRIDSAPPPATSTAPVPAKAAAARTFAAPSKLEPFLLLAKSARGAGAASLIDQVTAAPGVFAFGELLETKAVAEVCLPSWMADMKDLTSIWLATLKLEHSEQHSGKWLALQIFAYGNLADYRRETDA